VLILASLKNVSTEAEFGEETLAALGQTSPVDESNKDLIQYI
jgi:hypothetical protein